MAVMVVQEPSVADYVAANQRKIALLAGVIVLLSGVSAWLVLRFAILPPIGLYVLVLLGLIAWRPRVGLEVAFALVMLFETGTQDQFMLPGVYLLGGLGSTAGFTGAIASPLEMLLLLTFGMWLAQGVARRRLDFRTGRLFWPILLFFGFLVFGLLRGMLAGGDFHTALWESRFLFYIVICYVLATSTTRSLRDVGRLATIALLTMGLYAVEAVYRRVALIDTGQLDSIPEFWYSHEVVVFLAALILLIVAQQVFGGISRWQRILGLVLLPISIYALVATERRAGNIAAMAGFLVFSLVFLFAHRKAFFRVAIPVLVVGAIYLPLFWNSTGLIGQPARAVRSIREPDPRDAASNLYRDLESVDVRATIQSNPLLGVGFGREFLFVVPLPDLSWWPFWHYEPHHNILWVWLKTGAFGFIAFFVLMGTGLARAAHLTKTLRDPRARTFALLCIAGIVTTLTFSYVDVGLTSGRVTVMLGVLLGTIAVLDQLGDGAPNRREPLEPAVSASGRGRLPS